jgi:hypothetical protein
MTRQPWRIAIRACLLLGAAIDAFVGLLCLFAPWAAGPLLDFPIKDPALATITGGELLVVTAVYAVISINPRRFQPLFFVVALDQFFAAALPALEMLRGNVAVTWKTAGPIPLSLALCAVFVFSGLSKQFADRREDSRYG